MKKKDTLKKNYEFKNVLTKGKCYFGKYINIYIIRENTTLNKIGIAVGKKVCGAVKRNQIKRWIRESHRDCKSKFKYNCRMVFVLRKETNIEELDFWKIKEDIENNFKKAGII